MPSDVLTLFRHPEAGGREAELSLLLREWDDARTQGRARFAFVRGPTGVGKSHLFRLFRQAAGARAADVFEADSARDGRRTFGLFAHLLPQLVEFLGHGGAKAETLARLSRAVAPVSRGQAQKDAQRLELFDAASELFVQAGRAHPVFLFPDVDAADTSSLELLRYLAAVVTSPEAQSGGLFVLSFRDDVELPSALQQVLDKVSARTVALGGLDLEGIRTFLARNEVAQRLFEATAGMPDALEELLSRPHERPVELFLRRLEKLQDGARAVLAVLAASPVALPVEVVAGAQEALGHAAGSAAAHLDELVRQHVLTVKVVGSVPAYRFSREGDKAALAASLDARALVEAQRALGRAFEAHGDLEHAAALLLQADPKEGAQVSLRAAEALAGRGAIEAAEDLLLRALPHLDARAKADAYGRLAQWAQDRGEARQALAYLARARVRGDDAAVLERSVVAARLLQRLGKPGWAERLLSRALLNGAPAVQAAARAQRVELALLRGRPDEAEALAHDEGLSQHPALWVQTQNAVGRARLMKGDLDGADRVFEENHLRAQHHGLVGDAARALLNRGVVAHKQGDRERAIRWYQAAAPCGERSVEARALANLGSLYAEEGQLELALEHLQRALQAFSRLGSAREVAHAASNLARLYAFLGDLPRAQELSEHALKGATEIGERYLQASALLNLGEALVDKGDLQEAARLLNDARALFEDVGNHGFAALSAAQKARAHLLLGERAQATSELSRKVMEKGCEELPSASIEAELVKGDLALALGDLHGAGRASTRARDALLHKPDLEGPYRVYFQMGKLRLAAGDVSGAQAEMARSARLLDELTQRVPPARRQAFLSIPRRAEVLGAVEPEVRLPRLGATASLRVPAQQGAHGLIGRSVALAKITRQIEPIARANATVLIRGESGTGKELLAQAIHDLSARRAMPMVKVNCAAMVEELLLSELFGHEKGAFTGAIRERKGRFELADGGTIFLDEIGDISPKAQVALLRVLQEREFERVGGTKTLKVDVRVICATNRDLEALIAQGRFRQDLYYRLKGVMLELPPLRERLEDLPVLADHFLTRVAKERNEAPRQLSGDALDLLSRHTWPGNVRELENVLASAAIFADGAVITKDCFSHVAELSLLAGGEPPSARTSLPPPRAVEVGPPAVVPTPAPAAPAPRAVEDEDAEESGSGASVADVDFYNLARARGLSLKDLRHQLEMQCIQRALQEAAGNISEAARLLKMKRSRLSQIVNSEPELKGVCHGDE